MNQGDVYWYSFRAPDKRRPVLILTRNSAISSLTGITVAQITTTVRNTASEVLFDPSEDGMFTECVVSADNIQTIKKAQLGEFITQLSAERMREVRFAIEFALGFDALA